MSHPLAAAPGAAPLAPWPLICRLCGTEHTARPQAVCGECLGPLEPVPGPRTLPSREEIAARPSTLWRYREWLPFDGPPRVSREVGWTPLVDAPRLAARLGLARVWIKYDGVSHPSLSFKDRVVATALNAALAFGLDTVGCASTGNLANAVAAQAAAAGLPAWIFIPEDLEAGKVVATAVHGPRLVRIRGHYDDVNRLCARIADRFGWGIVNVNLRSYYGEGSKTMAFEIVEQLGWRLPAAVVAPMAGGSLVTRLRKGFGEFREAGLADGPAPRIYGAQAAGCAPIVSLLERGGTTIEPVRPDTLARSIAIGNPADGLFARETLVESGGWGAAVDDQSMVDGIRLLAETTGLFTETAGGVTVAAAGALVRDGHLRPEDEVVLCITGQGLKTAEVVAPGLPESPLIPARLADFEPLVQGAPS